MLVGVVTAVLIAAGLPLLGWRVGSRRFWSRLRPGRGPDPWGHFVRRHGLSVRDAHQVASAVEGGRQLSDPRLRRAAVDMADEALREGWPTRPWLRATLMVLLAVLVLGFVLAAGASLVQGRPGDVQWWVVALWILLGVSTVRRRRHLRRAVELNSDPQPT